MVGRRGQGMIMLWQKGNELVSDLLMWNGSIDWLHTDNASLLLGSGLICYY